MIYGIIAFGHRKGSRIHRKGFRMFPEIFGYETLFWPKGKAHKAFGKCKRKFCGDQRLDARNPGVWPLDSAKLPFTLSKNLVGFPLWPK